MTVLSSVASDCFYLAIVSHQRNVESDDCVASLDEIEVLFRDIGLRGSSVEEKLYLLQESRLFEFINLGWTILSWI